MRKLALALAGTAALTFASAANATVALVGCTMNCDGPTTVGSETTIGYTDTGLGSPSFTESLSFLNDLPGLYSIVLTTSTNTVNFTSAVLSDAMGGSWDLHKIVDDGTNEYWSFLNPPDNQYAIGAGTYTLTIMGDNNGPGSLAGTVTINAVPEPAAWAMMLIGFGAIGASMRRRKNRFAVRQFA
jgi:hypothetical protein